MFGRPSSATAQRTGSRRGEPAELHGVRSVGARPVSAIAQRSGVRPDSAARRRPSTGGRVATSRGFRFRCHYNNTIYDVLSQREGWRDMLRSDDGRYGDSSDWDLLWADRTWAREYMHVNKLREWQLVNHFRNSYELTRKDTMVKNLKRARKQLEKEGRSTKDWDFFPTTYVVPAEYGLFYEEFKRNPESTWIMKPVGAAQVCS
jgi:tubulin polyglutamylase TTLL9